MTATHFWVNGDLVEVADAKISVLDHGFTVADGVFETLLISDGRVFALDRHLDRLERSASGLGLGTLMRSEVVDAVQKVISKNTAIDLGRVRITITSGSGPLGSDRSNADTTVVVSISEQAQWPESVAIVLVPWTRNENSPLAGLKTTSYAENVYALAAAKSHGFSEAIYCDTTGRLCEGTGSNVFLVKKQAVITPSEASGLLRGITRDLVIEWSRAAGVAVLERDVDPNELWEADELFITSSTRDVQAVSELARLDLSGQILDKRQLEPGLMTKRLNTIFNAQRIDTPNP